MIANKIIKKYRIILLILAVLGFLYLVSRNHISPFVNFIDENKNIINTDVMEKDEQEMAEQYILPSDCVLELGARYGTVSAIINKKLKNPTHHVAVEPDKAAWEPLEKNKAASDSQFAILKGIISKKKYTIQQAGYGSRQVEDPNSKEAHYTMDEVMALVNYQPFTALVADCEGCIESFLKENEGILRSLRIVILEEDVPQSCNYPAVKDTLRRYGFKEINKKFNEVWRCVWIKQ